jgi:hypothetical protein
MTSPSKKRSSERLSGTKQATLTRAGRHLKCKRAETAAALLGLSSVSPLYALICKHHLTPAIQRGNTVWIPNATIQSISALPEVLRIRQMAELDELGGDLTDEDLQELSQTRFGRLPWQTQ